MDAPSDLSLWVGSMALSALVPEVVRRFVSRGDKATEEQRAASVRSDAEFKAEVRSDLKRLLDGQQTTTTNVALLQQTQASHASSIAAIEKRQDAQASAHLAAIEALRREMQMLTTKPPDAQGTALLAAIDALTREMATKPKR